MNLYLISQDVNNDYDTFDSAVVVAESQEQAKLIHPNTGRYRDDVGYTWSGEGKRWLDPSGYDDWGSWASPEDVKVEHIGTTEAYPAGKVICASFNAG